MPFPSVLLEVLPTISLSRESDSSEMPDPPLDSLVLLASSRLLLEFFIVIPALLLLRSLPRTRLSRAISMWTPLPFAPWTTLSISSLPSDSSSSRASPPVSVILLRSMWLSLDGSPAGARSVTPMRTPPPFSDRVLSATVLPVAPWSATPGPPDPVISLLWTLLFSDLSIQTPCWPLPRRVLSRTTLSFALLVSQTPRSLAPRALFWIVLPLTPDWLPGGNSSGGLGSSGSGGGGFPSAMPASWLRSSVSDSTLLCAAPVFSMTP